MRYFSCRLWSSGCARKCSDERRRCGTRDNLWGERDIHLSTGLRIRQRGLLEHLHLRLTRKLETRIPPTPLHRYKIDPYQFTAISPTFISLITRSTSITASIWSWSVFNCRGTQLGGATRSWDPNLLYMVAIDLLLWVTIVIEIFRLLKRLSKGQAQGTSLFTNASSWVKEPCSNSYFLTQSLSLKEKCGRDDVRSASE